MESNLKEGQICPIKRKFFIFFFLSVSYLPLFNPVTKNPGLKDIGEHLPPPPKLRLWQRGPVDGCVNGLFASLTMGNTLVASIPPPEQ
jgi:hypothetical protein